MAYHLPRVIYWIQSRSVSFFPTPYLNQIMLQPFAEYAMLLTYLLSGGDHFVNLIQFNGFAGSVIGAWLIAQSLGLDRRAQLVAALACATLPNAILQASCAKNDCLPSLWLAAAMYFAIRRQPFFLALALGLALGTKASAYIFVPPMLAAWFLSPPPRQIKWTTPLAILLAALAFNAPQYFRNFQLRGSPLGFDSAQADGVYRRRNERLGVRTTASNLLRNLSEQLGQHRYHTR
jgi:4-amino-4-deoxy-L-arabinose transferase-like glycosyltransferase